MVAITPNIPNVIRKRPMYVSQIERIRRRTIHKVPQRRSPATVKARHVWRGCAFIKAPIRLNGGGMMPTTSRYVK
jgi:hypothetical protein